MIILSLIYQVYTKYQHNRRYDALNTGFSGKTIKVIGRRSLGISPAVQSVTFRIDFWII